MALSVSFFSLCIIHSFFSFIHSYIRHTSFFFFLCISFLGQVVLNPTTNGPKAAELHKMVIPKNSQDTDLKIKLAVRMDKPPNMKHSGYVHPLWVLHGPHMSVHIKTSGTPAPCFICRVRIIIAVKCLRLLCAGILCRTWFIIKMKKLTHCQK